MSLTFHGVLSADGTLHYSPPVPIAEISIVTPAHVLYVSFSSDGAKVPLPVSSFLTILHHGAVTDLYFSGTAADAFDLILTPIRVHFQKIVNS